MISQSTYRKLWVYVARTLALVLLASTLGLMADNVPHLSAPGVDGSVYASHHGPCEHPEHASHAHLCFACQHISLHWVSGLAITFGNSSWQFYRLQAETLSATLHRQMARARAPPVYL